jgi:GTP cyclohydrolase I
MTLTWSDIQTECARLVARCEGETFSGVYGVPQGGVPVALIVAQMLKLPVLDSPDADCLVVDDLVDSGKTLSQYKQTSDALYRKPHSPAHLAPNATEVDEWLIFPWEKDNGDPRDLVVRLLEYVGEDPTREGLLDTPKRVLKAFREMTEGYAQDPETILSTVFDEDYDQMVCLHNIEFVSMCEHHLQPFRGTAAIGYIPNGKVVGLSKLARLVDVYARRLQVQERMTEQIAAAIEQYLKPLGAAVYIEAHHSCMGNRGVRKHEGKMVTQKLSGAIKEDPAARAEFIELARGR